MLLTSIFGSIIAFALFLFVFMMLRAKVGLVFSTAYSGLGIAFIDGMAWLLNRDFPPGLLQEYINLP
ncbi:MAG: hypothetical protein ABJP79_07690 [Tateyamaria sp.]|uniref:hypothetical protein n=1 Tax=Tateyamaria sp. TaxID=1929288 RepID=UPI0032A10349